MMEILSGLAIVSAGALIGTKAYKQEMEYRSQLEADIKKTTNEFVESLKADRDKLYNNAAEECLSGIRKDLKVDVEKYLTRTREKLEADVEVVLGSVRKVLEADVENNKRGTPSDRETLIDAIDECLTDIKKLLEVKIEKNILIIYMDDRELAIRDFASCSIFGTSCLLLGIYFLSISYDAYFRLEDAVFNRENEK